MVLALVLVALSRPARACINATMAASEAIAKLKEAQRALDEGDVLGARELARDVRVATLSLAYGPSYEARLFERALRIEALSRIRDRDATPDQIESAVGLLQAHVESLTSTSSSGADNVTPALSADLGEALERAARDGEALDVLVPLADRDLIGSAHAYAALSRAASRRGDGARSTLARARCEAMATSPRVCQGEYPRQPLLRGSPLGYALPGLVFAAAALLRLLRQRRRPLEATWCTYRAPVFAAAIVLFGIAAVAMSRTVWLAASFALLASIVTFALQRGAFLSAVRRGAIADHHLRPAEAGDGTLPVLALWLGPRVPQTLERLTDPSYRQSPRVPLLRIVRRPPRAVWIAGAIAVGLAFAGCGSLVLWTARSPSMVVHD